MYRGITAKVLTVVGVILSLSTSVYSIHSLIISPVPDTAQLKDKTQTQPESLDPLIIEDIIYKEVTPNPTISSPSPKNKILNNTKEEYGDNDDEHEEAKEDD